MATLNSPNSQPIKQFHLRYAADVDQIVEKFAAEHGMGKNQAIIKMILLGAHKAKEIESFVHSAIQNGML